MLKHLHTRLMGGLLALGVSASLALPAAAQSFAVPGWLQPHVGLRDGQIAPLVLLRARELHQKQVNARKVSNPCYFAMDATRPSTNSQGQPSKRFYILCENRRYFKAISSGYGSGRNIPGANFRNGRQCAQHFSNAEGSNLTSGGSYLTSEVRTSFKGYYSQGNKVTAFRRPFLAFDGIGDNRNARKRFIGGHQATFLRTQCRMKLPSSRYADDQGYVRFGKLVDYSSGRSNGCTTWTASGTDDVLKLVQDNPSTVYIYPEADDIKNVARAVQTGSPLSTSGPYWDVSCLQAIGTPVFWPKRKLEPVIKRWRRSLPKSTPTELPFCN